MTNKHLSSQYDSELNAISGQIMELGGLAEKQISQAIGALAGLDADKAESVFEMERRANRMEIEIDHALTTVIALRQPTARDLRLLIAISKTTTNLERVCDEATKIARRVQSLVTRGGPRSLPASELRLAADLAAALIRRALDAFARLDTEVALAIIREDSQIDIEFDGFVRKLITYMMEDPRTISASLDLLVVAKALERIGDHAKNIAEFVIYIVKGADVRHTAPERIESSLE